jgi:pimeloyl-ACP methyl ester carboxylesterase
MAEEVASTGADRVAPVGLAAAPDLLAEAWPESDGADALEHPADPTLTPVLSPEEERAAWRHDLAELGEENGFYRELGPDHTALYVQSGDTLVVTFENLDHVFSHGTTRLPWGFHFIQSHGWSILGMMAHDWTWYRDEAVFDFFDALRDEGFFAQFKRVIFYGASMGGYAAAAFSAAAPGATVIVISPQATLDPERTPWETRYAKARHRDFNSRYGFGPASLASAEQVYLMWDPLARLDDRHAALFADPRIIRLKCRLLGHRIASAMQGMGILKKVVEKSIEGTLTDLEFYQLLRARRGYARYLRELMVRLEKRGKTYLVALLCTHYLATRRGPKFRKALRTAVAKLQAEGRRVPGA